MPQQEDYRIADLPKEEIERIRQIEAQLAKETGKRLAVVVYEAGRDGAGGGSQAARSSMS